MKIGISARQRLLEPQSISMSGKYRQDNPQIPSSQNHLIGFSHSIDAFWLPFFFFPCSRRGRDPRFREWGAHSCKEVITGIVDVSCSQARAPCANMKPRKKEEEEVGGRW